MIARKLSFCWPWKPISYPIAKIKTLEDIWTQKDEEITLKSFQQKNIKKIFLTAVRAIKQKKLYNLQIKNQFFSLLDSQIEDSEFCRQFICFLLPFDCQFPQLNERYLKIAHQYLQSPQASYKQKELFYLFMNLQRTVYHFKDFVWEDEEWAIRTYYFEQNLMKKFLPIFLEKEGQFSKTFLVSVVKLCSFLRVFDARLCQLIFDKITKNKLRLNLSNFFYLISYLNKNSFFPYEFFYRQKEKWILSVSFHKKYSRQKIFNTLNFFKLFIECKPPKCQPIEAVLLQLMNECLEVMDTLELAKAWYLLSKYEAGLQPAFLIRIINKINELLDTMNVQSLSLLVRGFSRVKYSYMMDILVENGLQVTLEKIINKIEGEKPYQAQICRVMILNVKNQQPLQ